MLSLSSVCVKVTMAVDGNVIWRHFSFERIVDDDAIAFEFPPSPRSFCKVTLRFIASVHPAYMLLIVTCWVLHNLSHVLGTRFALHLVQRGTSYWPLL